MSLEPIDPETALGMYLADKANDLTKASLGAHEHRLIHFVRWCNEKGIENLNMHYDRRTEREKMEQRREYLDNI